MPTLLANISHIRHLLSNTRYPHYPPNATIYHSIYDQSIPIRQSFVMTITPASPQDPTDTPDHREADVQAPNSSEEPSAQQQQQQQQTPPIVHEVLEWETPRNPPKRRFISFLASRKQPNVDSAQEDTEYHAASKEAFAVSDAAIGGGGAGIASSGVLSGTRNRFNSWIPAHRTYFGHSRTTFLLVVSLIFLCFLALILGLAIGLSRKHSPSPTNLPLPTNKSIFTGDITYYDPGGPWGYGSCGLISYSTSSICAVSHILYDAASTSANPNDNPLCGQKLRITRYDAATGGNHSVDVRVVDRCVGCKVYDLDLSQSVFEDLAEVALGRTTASWAWL